MSKIANANICFCGRLIANGQCKPCGVTFESAHKHLEREKKLKKGTSEIPTYVRGGKDNLPTWKEKKNIPKDEPKLNSLGWLYKVKNKSKVE